MVKLSSSKSQNKKNKKPRKDFRGFFLCFNTLICSFNNKNLTKQLHD